MSRMMNRGFKAAAVFGAVAALALPNVAHASAAVQDVNTTLLNSIRAGAAGPPPRAARAIAMVTTATFDAVNAGSHMGYDGYSYNGPAVSGVSKDALAISAGYTMMANLFPALAPSLLTTMNTRLSALPVNATIRANSLAVGSTIANNFFNARANDGASVAQSPYTPGTDPGDFQPVQPGQPVLPGWGAVTTFAATSSSQFGNGAPPALGSAEFIADFNEVKALGCSTCGTAEQQLIAQFWADGGGTFTPPGHWIDITNGLIGGLSTLEAARVSSLVGLSVADAGITAWQDKYQYDLFRPVTAINTCTLAVCGVDGEPGWTPFLSTPNFPTYVSGHSSFSGGAAGALTSIFGNNVSFCTPADPASGVVGNRCFTSLRGAADEAGISRIYGGIHFEFDNGRAVNNAFNLGTFVADTQLQRTGAVPEPASWAMLIAGFGLVGGVARRRRVSVVSA
ncbi:PEPxxWA-CTERM sorting domain-containing protein [Sandarakinorhabdus sp. AAP62]|uniref:PEPxxWA-CTERM sorting domain-containing protein n=1 Tax=Sandarakinorhabdus sp. AAP62 TaxID=1248916 RepID=UPI0002DED64B|nr:PEPxxWA-CTERM sorting domain-containing protein [Sandarakinorhabdus sp. AAP62]